MHTPTLHAHTYAARTHLHCTHTPTLHVHTYAARTHRRCTHTPMLHAHTYAARTHLRCTHTPTLHVHTYAARTDLRCAHTPTEYAHTYRVRTHLQSTYKLYTLTYTSLAVENVRSDKASILSHFTGSLLQCCTTYTSSVCTYLLSPKSAIFIVRSASSKRFLAARSRCM